ncbi:cytochrome P450 [Truncatella angustata]|uniref:Cytochrome P450 n=1 Tax=Truncatella angustata TaxID=152316 RepID=A0A9P8US91_9PEZI|nr:cytochrome P450 [Truncatella angustata]KAH6657279.1 cytochrome P450 [Truncatella angustata]
MANTLSQPQQWLAMPELSVAVPVAVALLSPFLLTYAYTSFRYFLALYSDGPTPATPPYFVPMLGHTIPFGFDTDRYLRSLRSRFGQNPVRLLVGSDILTFVPHGEMIQTLFKSREVNGKAMAIKSISAFGYKGEDLKLLDADNSGTLPSPNPGFEDWPPEKRFWFTNYRAMHGLLQGATLVDMLSKFIEKYTARVEGKGVGFDEWTTIDDLFGMMKDDLFHAAMQALCGDHVFEVAPDMAENFWKFDSSLPTIFKKVPRWLAPSAHAARDRVLGDIKKYLDYADEHFDWNNEELVDCDWEPIYGAKLMRVRQQIFRKIGQRKEAGPAAELGLIWATNSNVIPTAFWTVLGILKSESLKARAVAEIDEAFQGNTAMAAAEKLCSSKLSMSMYHESLRYAVGVMTVRSPNADGYRIGRWGFKKSDILVTSSWAGHRDETFWNTGRILPDGTDEYPVNTWWAERFLEYPSDPASGPVRKPDPAIYRTEKKAVRTHEDDKRATVVTAGTSGHSFPYGGGIKICPGRFFAKNEMIAGAAMLLRMYDIELVDPVAASKVGLNMHFFPFGALPPDGKVAVRIRRRKL